MSELEELTHYLEKLFLRKIVEGLRSKTMSIPDSKQFALDFMKMEPFISIEDATAKTKEFTDTRPIFLELFEYMNSYHKEQFTGQIVDQMREHLKNNDIDKALEIAKQSV